MWSSIYGVKEAMYRWHLMLSLAKVLYSEHSHEYWSRIPAWVVWVKAFLHCIKTQFLLSVISFMHLLIMEMSKDIPKWLTYIRFVTLNHFICMKVNRMSTGTFTILTSIGFVCSCGHSWLMVVEWVKTLPPCFPICS
jgi:hypothetical protein